MTRIHISKDTSCNGSLVVRNRCVRFLGNPGILNAHKTAFLCSRRCPAEVILQSYDWAIEQRNHGNCIISGFHSQIEKDVFRILIRGSQPMFPRSAWECRRDALRPLWMQKNRFA